VTPFGCAPEPSAPKATNAAPPKETTMSTVKSNDGTAIAYAKSGSGPALVLVHGTTADHARWAPILPSLEKKFTVYAIDRRGRGASGDAATYAIEREFEDVAAVVDSIGGPVRLLGHSYGAVCSLEASLRTKNLAKLVLYEPPIPSGVAIYPPGSIENLQSLLASGDRDAVVTTFFRGIVKMPESEVTMMKSLPNWPARVAAAHTIPRELLADETYRFDAARFASMKTPTLLLLGGDSPAFFKAAIDNVHAAVATSKVVVLPGQQHTAINTAPDLFLREVLAFLE
jgi:pimeloyl-ACP methyl ester carboxylesterase